jgi:ABC-type xylose transport system permease subunit
MLGSQMGRLLAIKILAFIQIRMPLDLAVMSVAGFPGRVIVIMTLNGQMEPLDLNGPQDKLSIFFTANGILMGHFLGCISNLIKRYIFFCQ